MGSSSGGGDGGAADRKAAEESRQQSAIARLNRAFGVAGSRSAAPDRAAFEKRWNPMQPPRAGQNTAGPDPVRWYNGPAEGELVMDNTPRAGQNTADSFDQTGFDAAMASYNNEDAETAAQRNARESLYGKFSEDARNLQLADLNKERGLAERDVSFDLARRGLTGGSRQIDVGRDISDQFNRGVLTAENNAQDVANQARQGDEKTRLNLMQSIRGGMGEADAVSSALAGMRNTADQAANQARGQNIGGFFDAIRGAAQARNEQDSYQKAFEKYRTGGGAGGGGYGGNSGNV